MTRRRVDRYPRCSRKSLSVEGPLEMRIPWVDGQVQQGGFPTGGDMGILKSRLSRHICRRRRRSRGRIKEGRLSTGRRQETRRSESRRASLYHRGGGKMLLVVVSGGSGTSGQMVDGGGFAAGDAVDETVGVGGRAVVVSTGNVTVG